MLRILFILPLLMLGCDPAASRPPEARPSARPDTLRVTAPRPHMRAVTLDARRRPGPTTLPSLAALGASHIALTSFGFQPAHDAPEIRTHYDAGWYSESDAGIRALAAEARTLGLGVILKPHIWVGGYSSEGQTRHRIAMASDADWARWEAAYRDLVLHYAALATEVDADLLVVGTELGHVARTREAFWRALIADVRRVYDGPLTYAANWYDEYEHVPFWDALDFVGIQAYFPVSEAPAPSPEALAAGWDRHAETLEAFAARHERPILFTEIGYRDVGYAAAEPWRWPERGEGAPPDTLLQARLYHAFFERVWHRPWMAGAILWKWYPDEVAPRPGDFSPQGKPAAAVIERHFRASAGEAR